MYSGRFFLGTTQTHQLKWIANSHDSLIRSEQFIINYTLQILPNADKKLRTMNIWFNERCSYMSEFIPRLPQCIYFLSPNMIFYALDYHSVYTFHRQTRHKSCPCFWVTPNTFKWLETINSY